MQDEEVSESYKTTGMVKSPLLIEDDEEVNMPLTESCQPIIQEEHPLDKSAREFCTEPTSDKPASESSQVAVPEHSHPGESQANGKAERTIQLVEDHVRTMMAAFEFRFKTKLSNTHP